ncbi:unnamed protein product [Rotaria sp. Silwood1]|nr:unnamed protein product [Rotaria sp. Silwood1]CAF4632941.1 unnamed protein product [Rotaria sp. Silwood1]CAF4789663.1 unnamed protein product [Rotaria sp. Silwood1]
MLKSSYLIRHSLFQLKRFIHLTIPSLTAGQTQYHGQKNSTWWEKYETHVDPVQTRTDLLNMDDLDERHYRPIKPVISTYQSFSCFHDPIISRVIGILLREGDRELVEELMHKTFRTIKLIQIGKYNRAKTQEERDSIECNPVTLLKQAIKNATPIVRLTRIAKGGTLYSVPIPMSPTRGTYTAIRLLIDSTHDARPHDQRFWTLFAKEIMDAAQNQGRTIIVLLHLVIFSFEEMNQFINKLLGKDDEHCHSHKSDEKCESETCNSLILGGEKLGCKTDNKPININTDEHIIEGRTIQHDGVNIKSTVSSDVSSTVSIANQQKLTDLVSKLSSTHAQINEYANRQTAKIDEEIQREIDLIVARTRQQQEELLRKANEETYQIDAEYRLRLQKMVEEIDANKAKRIADIEKELNKLQGDILQGAKNDIDLLNKKAASLKLDILQEAQSRAALETNDLTSQAKYLGQASTLHQSTGTTTIKTDISAVATANETNGTKMTGKVSSKDTHVSTSGAHRI